MKKKAIIKYLSGVTLAAFLFGACTTEVDWENLGDNLKIDQSLVLPLGEATLTLEDILNQLDSIDFINTEGSDIFIEFSDTLSWGIREYKMNLNTVPVEKTMQPSPNSITPIPANFTITYPFNEVLELGINANPIDQRVDYVRVNSAKLKVTLYKENLDIAPENVKVTLTFPDQKIVFDNPAITSIVQTPTSFGATQEIVLSPFTMRTYNASSSIPINITLEITTGNSMIIASPASSVSFKLDISDFDLKVAYGFFKPTISNESQIESVDLGDFQKDLPEGLFKLSEPSMKLTVTNNVGLKLGVNIDYLKAYRKDEVGYDTVYAKFKNDLHSTKIIINPSPEYGVTSTTSYTIDKDTGQIHRLFENKLLANKLDYRFTLSNERTEGVDFIIPKPKIDVKLDLKIPLRFSKGSYVEFIDTIADLRLDSILNQDYIDNVTLVLKVTNGLPVGVNLKLKMIDENSVKVNSSIDSIFTVNAPAINLNGYVDRTKLIAQEIKIEIKKAQLPQLRNARHIIYSIRVDRKDDEPIKFEKSNSFGIKAGIFVKGDMGLDFNNNNDND